MMQVWLDLETTGLDEGDGEILEVGFILLPGGGQSVEFEAVAGGLGSDWEDLMPEAVVEMHMATGLLGEVNGDESAPLTAIEGHAVDVLDQFGEQRDFVLCGSGVSHFDRRWLDLHMPLLAAWFHRGSIDVGVLRLWLTTIGRGDLLWDSEPSVPHRALPDAQDALDQYLWYSSFLGSITPR